MENIPQRIAVGSRVRLKDGVSPEMYGGLGLPGNEGWIKKHETDKYGYHRVFVQWDKDHWSYNGAKDIWTWESHFDQVEEPMTDTAPSEDKLEKIVSAFVKELRDDLQKDNEKAPPDTPTDTNPNSDDDSYEEIVSQANSAAAEGLAFLTIAMVEEKGTVYPLLFQAQRDKKFKDIIYAQLGKLSQLSYEEMVLEKLQNESAKD